MNEKNKNKIYGVGLFFLCVMIIHGSFKAGSIITEIIK